MSTRQKKKQESLVTVFVGAACIVVAVVAAMAVSAICKSEPREDINELSIAELTEKMNQAVEKEDYTTAIVLRNRIRDIKRINKIAS